MVDFLLFLILGFMISVTINIALLTIIYIIWTNNEYLKSINVTKEIYSKAIMECKNKLKKGKFTMKNNFLKNLKDSNGITLIALVITIIVLLILAGISISMLAGDNSILQKATTAKENTDKSQITERIQLAYHSALTGGQGSYTKDTLMEELKNEFKTNYDVDDTDDENWKMIAQGQEVIIPAGKKGEVLAKDKLIINVEGTTDAEISPYVKYNGELYRVLYDLAYDEKNGTNYGIEIVSVNPLDTVTLGKDDPIILESNEYEGDPGEIGTTDRAKWSYNNAIITLNKKAQTYLTELADSARCIGSDPNNPISESGNYSGNNIYDTDAAELKGQDTHGLKDIDQLYNIEALKFNDTTISSYYWFATRRVGKIVGYPAFQMGNKYYNANGLSTSFSIYYYKSDGTPVASGGTLGFRPVIRLKNNIKIEKGKGTADEPYEIGI